jgi:hypothetical protein
VIPSSSAGTCDEGVCKTFTQIDRTLADHGDAIHLRCTFLGYSCHVSVSLLLLNMGGLAMEMDTRRFVTQAVLNIYNHGISDTGFQYWARPITVDSNHRTAISVGTCCHPTYIPIVSDGFR